MGEDSSPRQVVVVLRRGEDRWEMKIPDATSIEDAETRALRHANGHEDVPPSNGPAGWTVEQHLDRFRRDGGKEIS